MKRIIMMLLVLVLSIATIPNVLGAETGGDLEEFVLELPDDSLTNGYWTVSIDGSTVMITDYSGDETDVVIPTFVSYLGEQYILPIRGYWLSLFGR